MVPSFTNLLALLLSPPLAAMATSSRSQQALSPPLRPQRRLAQEEEEDQKERDDERYEILSSASILERMQKMVTDYPNLATLTTTQEWFGLPRAGKDADCPFDSNHRVHDVGCNNYVLIIHDKEAHPGDPDSTLAGDGAIDPDHYLRIEDYHLRTAPGGVTSGGSSGWRYVPDVFLSGAVHGNERVGPTTLVEMSELLLEAARCESMPRTRLRPAADDAGAAGAWERELSEARACRSGLADGRGVTPARRRWLARLASTRRTVVVPAANALGYSRGEREEGGVDPNRDFPFDVGPADSDGCMRTVAGRSVNELFRSHLFPVGLTFHGGMEVVAYEWGAPTYLGRDAPDSAAQRDVASAYSRYANGFAGHAPYDYGTMNDKVYYVRGGMEDWAFAGSWDPDRVVECTPRTLGGYPPEKTRYNNSTLRAFNMLVETSDPKAPGRDELGTRANPLASTDGPENGHVARNIRLALLAMDVVEPYVSIRGVGGLEFDDDDVIPQVNMRRYGGASYRENSKMIWVPGDGPVEVSWTVGGAFDVDDTELVVGLWDSLPSNNLADVEDGAYPSETTLDVINSNEFRVARPPNAAGKTRWHVDGPYPTTSSNSDSFSTDPTFEATIDTSNCPPGSTLAVMARAKVDKGWLQQSENVGPSGLGPLSHIVNARRNPSYLASNAGKVIRGKVDDWWYSNPITILLGSDDEAAVQLLHEAEMNDAPRSVDGDRVRAIHVNSRFSSLPVVMEAGSGAAASEPASTTAELAKASDPNLYSLGMLLILINLFALALMIRRRQQRRRYVEGILSDDEEFGVSVGPYSDDPAEDADARMVT